MDDKTVSTKAPDSGDSEKATSTASKQTMVQTSTTSVVEREHRETYGTAKTENLRDSGLSGLWHILLPTAVVVFCLTLLAIPLIILVPLLYNSLDPASVSHALLWVWITLIVIALGTATIAIRGFTKIFLTQAGNYHKV